MSGCRAALLALPLSAAGAFLALFALTASASSQQVTFSGKGDPEVDRRVQAALGGSYRLVMHDTVIRSQDTLRGPVLAAGVTVRLEGTIVGDLVGVASDLFIHPHASVTGTVVNGGGGLYPSALAHLGGTVDRPLALYTVSTTGSVVEIHASMPGRSLIAWDGLHGLIVPQYDRVDGLWLQAGAALRLPSAALADSAFLHGIAGWRSGGAAPALTHTIDLQLRRGRYVALAGEQRLTTTNDRWVRPDLLNSMSFLVVAADYRDYYDARRLFAAVARDWDLGRWGGHFALRAGRETDRSLRTRDTRVLFHRHDVRTNPPVPEGDIASVTAQAAAGWTGASSTFAFGGDVESAGRGAGGDFPFNRYGAWGTAALQGLWGHTLRVRWHVQGPLPGTDLLPAQRWSYVGGAATLPTFDIGQFPGDRVVFISEEYVIPLPAGLSVPMLGPPDVALIHAAGMGWTKGQSHSLEQNLGVELRSYGLALRVMTNPAHARRAAQFSAGFAFNAGQAPPARPYFDTRAVER